MLFIAITQSILFVIAIAVALRSLLETKKARQDTFLPVVIAPENFSTATGPNMAKASIRLRNLGHGIALDVKAKLTGIPKSYEKKIIEISPRIDKYVWEFGLMNTDLYTKSLPKIEFIITYKDIFNRTIATIYKVEQKKMDNGGLRPEIKKDSLRIKLP